MTVPTRKNPIAFKMLKVSLKSVIFTRTYVARVPRLVHKKIVFESLFERIYLSTMNKMTDT